LNDRSATRIDWARVGALFGEIQDLPEDKRAAHVIASAADPEVRAEVLAMLALQGRAPEALQRPLPQSVPERIGAFRVLRELGRGGMGVVYLAEQEQPRRLVAIKCLAGAPSEALLQRFRREAELLARLSHPGIAQIHEVGAGPPPHLVMEYVEGSDLAEHASTLAHRERIDLLARIADAVEHAHSRGIVHRDLKPGNVLVGHDGQPKVLDFGIAHLAGAHGDTLTATGMLLGTPAYMSPEQGAGKRAVDARADVYALGVIGYELLCGRQPLPLSGLTPLEALRVLQENTPVPLGRVESSLRGDLERIVGKCLHKEPSLRYPSAGALADDLRRYLAHEPVRAAPASPLRRAWLFARRSPALAAALTLALTAILAGSAVSWRQMQLARFEASRAEQAATASAAVTAAMTRLLSAARPDENGGAEPSVREALEGGAQVLLDDLKAQPQARRAFLAAVAQVYSALGEHRRVLELLGPELAGEPADDEDSLRMALEYAQAADAEQLFEQAAPWYARLDASLHGRAPADPLALELALAQVAHLRDRSQYAQAGQAVDALLAELEELEPGVPLALAQALQARAELALVQADFGGARAPLERARALQAQARGSEQARTRLDGLYGKVLRGLGETDRALELLRESLAWRLRVVGPDHPATLSVQLELAELLRTNTRFDEARGIVEDVRTRRSRRLGETHAQVAVCDNLVAEIDYAQARWAPAAAGFGAAAAKFERTLGPDHDYTLTARGNLAGTLVELGEAQAAVEVLNDLVERRRTAGSPLLQGLLLTRGLALEALSRQADAGRDYAEALEREQARPGATPSEWMYSQVLLARSRRRLGDAQAALPMLIAATGFYLGSPVGCGPRCAIAHIEWSRTLADLGRPVAEQLPPAEKALAVRTEKLGADHPLTAEARTLVHTLQAPSRPPPAR
jgi:predicted Ser/Thr protein kinase